jgi:tetratricopeptide (TPR) repeat protein
VLVRYEEKLVSDDSLSGENAGAKSQDPTAPPSGNGKDRSGAADARYMSLDEAFALAQENYQAGRPMMARNILLQIQKAQPGHNPALNLLGAVFYGLQNYDAAIQQWEEYVRRRPRDADGELNLTEAYRMARNLEMAEQHGRRAVELQPNSAAAHNNLGIVLQERGKLAKALEHIDEALKLEPSFARAHRNRGNTLRRMGMPWRAIEAYEEASKADPDSVELLNCVAIAQLDVQEFDKALTSVDRAIELDPKYAPSYSNKALILLRADREGGLPLVNKALELDPGLISAHLVRSQIYLDAGWLLEAYEDGLKVFSDDPDDPEVLTQMGAVSYQLGKNEDAISYLKRALELQPTLVRAHVSLANCYADSGRKDDSIAMLRDALKIDIANKAAVYQSLASVKTFESVDDEDLKAMEALLVAEPATVSQEQNNQWLHYALGKAYEDCKAHDLAFEQFELGAALKKKKLTFDPTKMEQQVDRIIDTFRSNNTALQKLKGMPTDLPLFILGMPRSGTTLLEQILDSHPDVYGAGELQELQIVMQSVMVAGKLVLYPNFLPNLNDKLIRDMGASYINRVMKKAGPRKRVTDKMPGNYMYTGLINRIFPNARIIACMRHPLDVCVSNFSILYAQGQDFSYDLEWLGRFYRAFYKLMKFWEEVLPKDRFLMFEYERAVSDFEPQVHRVLEFCGLPFDERCLRFHENPRSVRTASSKQVRSPVYKTAAGKWKRYEKHLGPLIEAIGMDIIRDYEARIGLS